MVVPARGWCRGIIAFAFMGWGLAFAFGCDDLNVSGALRGRRWSFYSVVVPVCAATAQQAMGCSNAVLDAGRSLL